MEMGHSTLVCYTFVWAVWILDPIHICYMQSGTINIYSLLYTLLRRKKWKIRSSQPAGCYGPSREIY